MTRIKSYFLNLFENDRKEALRIRYAIYSMNLILVIFTLACLFVFGNTVLTWVTCILLLILIIFKNIYSSLYLKPIKVLKNNKWTKIILANPNIHFIYMYIFAAVLMVTIYSVCKNVFIGVICIFVFIFLCLIALRLSYEIAKRIEDKIIK